MSKNFIYKEEYKNSRDSDELRARSLDDGGVFISITSIEIHNEVERSTDILSMRIPSESIPELIETLKQGMLK